jgi:hypothetical protein
MTNRSIDRQIAELMGYTYYKEKMNRIYVYDSSMSPLQLAELPYYSTDWNAMRLLVEWLQGKGMAVITEHLFNGKVSVALYDESSRQLSYSLEETAPLALCQAVLSLPEGVLKSE